MIFNITKAELLNRTAPRGEEEEGGESGAFEPNGSARGRWKRMRKRMRRGCLCQEEDEEGGEYHGDVGDCVGDGVAEVGDIALQYGLDGSDGGHT